MEDRLFAHVEDIVQSLAAAQSAPLRTRSHRWGVKAWFGDPEPSRLHYEAQVMGRKHVDGEAGLVLEIGFHAEARTEAENEAALAVLLSEESRWRPALGEDAVAGPFLGATAWRRLSEVWLEPDLSEEDVAFEIASRLVDYLDTLEPLR